MENALPHSELHSVAFGFRFLQLLANLRLMTE
jgi:hypothetical protein